MATRDDLDPDRTTEADEPNEATGEVLGISRVSTGATGEIRHRQGPAGRQPEGHITPLEDDVDLGARDVTKDGRGQTGPETGGHGSTPQRSGATGTDIGG